MISWYALNGGEPTLIRRCVGIASCHRLLVSYEAHGKVSKDVSVDYASHGTYLMYRGSWFRTWRIDLY